MLKHLGQLYEARAVALVIDLVDTNGNAFSLNGATEVRFELGEYPIKSPPGEAIASKSLGAGVEITGASQITVTLDHVDTDTDEKFVAAEAVVDLPQGSVTASIGYFQIVQTRIPGAA